MITFNYIEVGGSYKSRRVLAEDVVEFCIEQLMPRMKTLWIYVNLRNVKNKNIYGWCLEGNTNREFYIDILKSLEKEEFIKTICHEMIHVWQGATGKIKDRPGAKLWRCKDGKYRNYTNYDHFRQPWESEAYRMQDNLTKKFKESCYYV
tara:strand:+ start:997 stop:1443 length:447 start_codon:yes stop_codon:yes gene_type:complete